MKFFQDQKTKALRITVDDSELTKRLAGSANYKELTPAAAKKALGKEIDSQPAAVRTFLESGGEESEAAEVAAPESAPAPEAKTK